MAPEFLILGVFGEEQFYAKVRIFEFAVDEDFPLPPWIQEEDTGLAEQFVADAINTRLGELKRGIPYNESFLQALI